MIPLLHFPCTRLPNKLFRTILHNFFRFSLPFRHFFHCKYSNQERARLTQAGSWLWPDSEHRFPAPSKDVAVNQCLEFGLWWQQFMQRRPQWPGPLLVPGIDFTKHHLHRFPLPFSLHFIGFSLEDKGYNLQFKHWTLHFGNCLASAIIHRGRLRERERERGRGLASVSVCVLCVCVCVCVCVCCVLCVVCVCVRARACMRKTETEDRVKYVMHYQIKWRCIL